MRKVINFILVFIIITVFQGISIAQQKVEFDDLIYDKEESGDLDETEEYDAIMRESPMPVEEQPVDLSVYEATIMELGLQDKLLSDYVEEGGQAFGTIKDVNVHTKTLTIEQYRISSNGLVDIPYSVTEETVLEEPTPIFEQLPIGRDVDIEYSGVDEKGKNIATRISLSKEE